MTPIQRKKKSQQPCHYSLPWDHVSFWKVWKHRYVTNDIKVTHFISHLIKNNNLCHKLLLIKEQWLQQKQLPGMFVHSITRPSSIFSQLHLITKVVSLFSHLITHIIFTKIFWTKVANTLTHSAIFYLIGNPGGFRYGMRPSFEISCRDMEIIGIDYRTQSSTNKDWQIIV